MSRRAQRSFNVWISTSAVLVTAAVMATGAQTRKPAAKPWNWEMEQQLEKAMQADGLGRSITIEAPVLSSKTIERVTLRPTVQWGHTERHGDVIAPLAPDQVSVVWKPSDGFVGRLVIDGVFNRVRCRFEGGIAADRVTVTGDADCGGQRGAFRARINRPEKP